MSLVEARWSLVRDLAFDAVIAAWTVLCWVSLLAGPRHGWETMLLAVVATGLALLVATTVPWAGALTGRDVHRVHRFGAAVVVVAGGVWSWFGARQLWAATHGAGWPELRAGLRLGGAFVLVVGGVLLAVTARGSGPRPRWRVWRGWPGAAATAGLMLACAVVVPDLGTSVHTVQAGPDQAGPGELSGRISWTRPDADVIVLPGRDGPVLVGSTGATGVDGATGATTWRWRREVGWSSAVVSRDGRTIAILSRNDGRDQWRRSRLTVLDARTGEVRTDALLPQADDFNALNNANPSNLFRMFAPPYLTPPWTVTDTAVVLYRGEVTGRRAGVRAVSPRDGSSLWHRTVGAECPTNSRADPVAVQTAVVGDLLVEWDRCESDDSATTTAYLVGLRLGDGGVVWRQDLGEVSSEAWAYLATGASTPDVARLCWHHNTFDKHQHCALVGERGMFLSHDDKEVDPLPGNRALVWDPKAKRRDLMRYDETGRVLGSVEIPASHLLGPALDDGTLVSYTDDHRLVSVRLPDGDNPPVVTGSIQFPPDADGGLVLSGSRMWLWGGRVNLLTGLA